MLLDYYVNQNAQSNGDHEVHVSTCQWLLSVQNKIYLGRFNNCFEAVVEAKKHFVRADGCYYCCNPCHTS